MGLQLGVWPDLSELLSGLLQVLRQVPMVVLLSMIPLVHHQILLPAEVKHFGRYCYDFSLFRQNTLIYIRYWSSYFIALRQFRFRLAKISLYLFQHYPCWYFIHLSGVSSWNKYRVFSDADNCFFCCYAPCYQNAFCLLKCFLCYNNKR